MRDRNRKWSACLVAWVLLFLTGCQGWQAHSGRNAGQGQKNEKLQVATTIFPYYDFVRQVAGDLADVTMIVPAGMDTHSFEPTARDMIALGQADVFLYNGGELESWVPRMIEAVGNDKWFVDRMIDCVDTLAEEHVEGMKEEKGHALEQGEDASESEGPEGDEADEHIWTSPVNACVIVARIAEDLGRADPPHREEYQENAQNYIRKLEMLDHRFRQVAEAAESRYLVFADRFPLRYFVEEYNIEYTAAFAGCSSDTEPSADTIAYLTDQMKSRGIPVVLKIELTSGRVADAIAEAAGARVETFHTCHNVTREQFDSGVSYLGLMEQNISVLEDALGVKQG